MRAAKFIIALCCWCLVAANVSAAFVAGPVNDAATGLPGTTPLHFRLLTTTLSGTNLFPTRSVDLTATNGQFTQYLAPGNWYVQIGTNKDAFQFSMPSDNGTYPLYTLLPPGVTYIFTPSPSYNLISADQAAHLDAAQTGSAALTNLANGDASGLTNLPSGGGGVSLASNLIPAGALYDDGTSDMALNGPNGEPVFALSGLIIGNTYIFTKGSNEQDDGVLAYYCSTTNDFGFSYTTGGKLYGYTASPALDFTIWVATTNTVYLSGLVPSSAVGSAVVLKTNTFYGSFVGFASLVLDANSTFPESILPGDVVRTTRPLDIFATNNSGQAHNIYSSQTANGSTLFLTRYGTNGYADIGFSTAPNLGQALANPTLRFAVGAEVPGVADTYPGSAIYANPYTEMYDGTGYMFVNYPYRVGGFESSSLNFALYADNGDLDHPGFYYNRAANTLTGAAAVGSQGGDISGTLGNMSVDIVGGTSSGNVSSAVSAVQTANSSANPDTLARYDDNGNLTANTVVANTQMQTPGVSFPQTGVQIQSGFGDPISNALDLPAGSEYLQADGGAGSTLWINESGGPAGWVSK